ncbi:hypothetical protein QQ045_008592 [Rhodiola kirilowii]
MEEPDFHQTDPAVVLTYIPTNARLKLGPAKVGDRQQLEWFYNSCNGVQQAIHPTLLNSIQAPAPAPAPVVSPSAPPVPLNYEFSINMNVDGAQSISSIAQSDLSVYYELTSKGSSSNWTAPEAGPSIIPSDHIRKEYDNNLVASAPLAPPLPNECVGTGLIHYPTVDTSSIDLSIPAGEMLPSGAGEKKKKKEEEALCCAMCFEAPVEGACIPCGHMAGCMECLNEIKMKKMGCPVCRAKIDQVVRLYAV